MHMKPSSLKFGFDQYALYNEPQEITFMKSFQKNT